MPKYVNHGIYCMTCQSLIREFIKNLIGTNKREDVLDAMDKHCSAEESFKLDNRILKAESLKAACLLIMQYWSDELEDFLVNRDINGSFEELVT